MNNELSKDSSVFAVRRPPLNAHVPLPPDQNPDVPPGMPPPGDPDHEVDLPPREDPDNVREPNTPPNQDPPIKARRQWAPRIAFTAAFRIAPRGSYSVHKSF